MNSLPILRAGITTPVRCADTARQRGGR